MTRRGVELGSAEFWQRLDEDPRRLAVEVCMIDLRDLSETLQQHPALRAWVNAAHEVARIEEEQGKWELTRAKAKAILKAREEAVKGKTNQLVLEAQADLEPDVIQAQKELFEAQRKRGALRAMATALDDRKDMLIQIAAKQRREQEDYR